VPAWSASIPIENASFEAPIVEPGGFDALPFVDSWTEIDLDTEFSTNTGVFLNTPEGSFDHVVNADGSQLAFLASSVGNALEQDLAATYKPGCDYRLTVGVGVSVRYPPSTIEPIDTLDLVLYYRDGNDVIDISSYSVEALGIAGTELTDFSLYLPAVRTQDAWAGMTIGVALRATGNAGGFWDLDNVRLIESVPVSIPIENASFEAPVVEPNGFGALPFVESWMEIDLDAEGSTNTGVFLNTPEDSFDHVSNADGNQLAFLASSVGNALEQDLAATCKPGCEYRLTAGVGVSSRYPPSTVEPVDTLDLVLYYRDGNDVVDIATEVVEAVGISATELTDFSLYLPTVQTSDEWAEQPIGVALRATGNPGGFWDLDNVRLIESLPVSIPIENASFEAPVVEPDGFGAVPFVDSWTEIDLDAELSTNTGVFLNTSEDSFDHSVNADGSQLAFLASSAGNALEQDLAATYKLGCVYRLTVGVGISVRYPPSTVEPIDTLDLVLYYRDGDNVVDIATKVVDALNILPTELIEFSLYLPQVQPGDAWAGKPIGLALRATGNAGGFWDLDNVRLAESLPEQTP